MSLISIKQYLNITTLQQGQIKNKVQPTNTLKKNYVLYSVQHLDIMMCDL